MNFVVSLTEAKDYSASELGGKGISLANLATAGFAVPIGFVVTTGALRSFVGSQISELPESLVREIRTAFESLGVVSVAVRSSATGEDSSQASWAGQLTSYLYTSSDQLIPRIIDCWTSAFSQRALLYRNKMEHHVPDFAVAVVVQVMIDADVAGVCFTAHPVTGDRAQLVIEAGFGLGEAVVSGIITPDTYILSKASGEVTQRAIGRQTERVVRSAKGGTKLVAVPKEKQALAKLTPSQIVEIAEVAQQIENYYQAPQDIEWAISDGKLWILQSRPITTLVKN